MLTEAGSARGGEGVKARSAVAGYSGIKPGSSTHPVPFYPVGIGHQSTLGCRSSEWITSRCVLTGVNGCTHAWRMVNR